MIRFYAPDIATEPVLPEVESGHAVRVLRHREGDAVEVVDGCGNLYSCTIVAAHPKHTTLRIDSVCPLPKVWTPRITLAVAPTKNIDRMEWLVEKLTEIGVDRIVPLRCERSERRELKPERLEKIAVSAMKQSLKALLPRIEPVTPLKDYLRSVDERCRAVAWCDSEDDRRLFSRFYHAPDDVAILIGPEGDFTPGEVSLAKDCGFTAVSLGDNRLRTETAALVAVDTVHIINQREL